MGGVLTGVLAGAVHGRHPGALLGGGGLPQGQIDDVDQSKLLVVPQHIGIDVVVDAHGLCRVGGWGGGARSTFGRQEVRTAGPGAGTLPELATMSLENSGFRSVL